MDSSEREIHSKICALCGEIKPLDGFYRDNRRKDGRISRCKPCKVEYNREYRKRPEVQKRTKKYFTKYHQDYYNKHGHSHYLRPEGMEERRENKRNYMREYMRGYEKHTKRQESIKTYKKNHPERIKAQRIIAVNIQQGLIPSPLDITCTDCGQQAAEYHHPDYRYPLLVIPLCTLCHGKKHRRQETGT